MVAPPTVLIVTVKSFVPSTPPSKEPGNLIVLNPAVALNPEPPTNLFFTIVVEPTVGSAGSTTPKFSHGFGPVVWTKEKIYSESNPPLGMV